MIRWEIRRVKSGEEADLLNEGWEPFSTNCEKHNNEPAITYIHLRRERTVAEPDYGSVGRL